MFKLTYKLHLPKYNRAGRKTRFSFALYSTENSEGYLQLIIDKLDPTKNEIISFTSYAEGKEKLYTLTEKHKLCQKINLLYKSKGSCFQYQLKECNGACINKENPETYNTRVKSLLDFYELPRGELFLQVKGRNDNEKGIIYIKDRTYK